MLSSDKARLHIVIDEDLDRQVRVRVAENRGQISDFVAEALRYYLKNYTRIQKAKNKESEF